MRIVIELTKTAEPEDVLRELYKSTPMESTFSIIMLALVDGEPRLLSLKQSLRVYIEHRLEIVRRRSEFDLERARQRAHILEGLRIALNFLDEVISIIRKAPDADVARERLIKRFKLSDIQTQAILDMPLQRLAALERKKIEDEYKELLALIKELEAFLRSPKKMRQVVDEELQAIKENFGDRRRTHIVQLKAGEPKVSMLGGGLHPRGHPLWSPAETISSQVQERCLGERPIPWVVITVPFPSDPTRRCLWGCSSQAHSASAPASAHTCPDSLCLAGNLLSLFSAFHLFNCAAL